MALIKTPRLKRPPNELKKDDYLEGRQKNDLSTLSNEELIERYCDIEQQFQFMKGAILLELRNRFPSNIEFGNWVKSVSALCADGHQTLNRYMHFANYFKDKDSTGISLTACYEISAPVNEDVADKVYKYALNKNLSVADIKAKIKEEKKLLPILEINSEEHDQESFTETDHDTIKKEELMPREDVSEFVKLILSDVQSLSQNEAVRVLKLCLKELNKHSVADGVADAKL
jgi:hypothetical protein